MKHFPIFLASRVAASSCPAAARPRLAKLRLLLKTEARLTVFAPASRARDRRWAAAGRCVHRRAHGAGRCADARCWSMPPTRMPPRTPAPRASPAPTARWSTSSTISRTASSSPPPSWTATRSPWPSAPKARRRCWRAPSRPTWKRGCPPRWAARAHRQGVPPRPRGAALGPPPPRFLGGLLFQRRAPAMEDGGEEAGKTPCKPF